MKNVEISGPYPQYYHGTSHFAKISFNEYFVSRFMDTEEIHRKIEESYKISPEYGKLKERWYNVENSVCIGKISEIIGKGSGRFVISNYYPDTRFDTLDDAIMFLVDNEGKLTFLS